MEVIFWIVMFILISPLIVLGAIDGPSMKKMVEEEKQRKKREKEKQEMVFINRYRIIEDAPDGRNYFLLLSDRTMRSFYNQMSNDFDGRYYTKKRVLLLGNRTMNEIKRERGTDQWLKIDDLTPSELETLREAVDCECNIAMARWGDKVLGGLPDYKEETTYDYGEHTRQILIAAYLLSD